MNLHQANPVTVPPLQTVIFINTQNSLVIHKALEVQSVEKYIIERDNRTLRYNMI